jgi:hypothetical protein
MSGQDYRSGVTGGIAPAIPRSRAARAARARAARAAPGHREVLVALSAMVPGNLMIAR